MTNQLAASNTQALVGSFTQTELDTIKGTIAKGTSNEQFALFVQTCVSSGLNPFLNQIYCITYNGKDGPVMSIQIAVEGIVALAKKNPQYKGFRASEVKENDEFEIDMITGEPVHKIKTLQRGKTIGAYCVAYRDNAPDMAVIITNDQVEHLLKGRNGEMWKNYYDDMIVKHAIKRAFKRQFGIEVAEDEAAGQGETIDNVSPYDRRDITPPSEPIKELEPERGQPEEEKPPAAQVNDMVIVMGDIVRAFRTLGVTNKDEQKKILATEYAPKKDKHTLAELKGILKTLLIKVEEAKENDGLEPIE
ncbi:RecT family recombinase [Bacillus sp. FJAT-26390]|uniref:RecT family recombinase n=1 Tax=Bacillus sp. FJAT-26390 TaxID=1743142 RepID=UPI000807C903|nr:RecT family recombinase [Bacillus sp. FJAT-26390]OBZ13315.1 RecT protein [Bacillus sp. FJAT-26390]